VTIWVEDANLAPFGEYEQVASVRHGDRSLKSHDRGIVGSGGLVDGCDCAAAQKGEAEDYESPSKSHEKSEARMHDPDPPPLPTADMRFRCEPERLRGPTEAPKFQCPTLPEVDWSVLWLGSCNNSLDDGRAELLGERGTVLARQASEFLG